MDYRLDMTSEENKSSEQNRDIDFRDLLLELWKGKWIIIFATFLFAVGATVFAITRPNIYQANALLTPTESSSSGGLSTMAGQLGGLAALTGVSLGNDSGQAQLAMQVIRSRKFVDLFVKKHDLAVSIVACVGWNATNNELIIDEGLYDSKSGKWLRQAEGLRTSEPTPQEIYEIFVRDNLSISLDNDSGLYTISVSHFSPFIAAQWVNWLIEDINNVMRERTITEASQNLDYLKAQLSKTSISEMQSTFYKLIEEQTKSLMLAEAQEEFVFKTIDPAVVPEVKSKPNRALICILGTLVGGLIGLSIVMIRFVYRNEKKIMFKQAKA